MSVTVPVFASPSPRVSVVPIDRPWSWLAAGWKDLTAAWRVSLAYGAGLVVLSFLLTIGLWLMGLFYLVLPLAGGFFIVAPLLATGLYEVSRRLAAGETVDLRSSILAWRRPRQIAMMGVVLLLIHLVWVRVALLLFALFFYGQSPSLEMLLPALLNSSVSLPFLVTGTIIGAAFACVAFAVSVVSIPMLVDRDTGLIVAIATSATAARVNLRAMALWAALIVGFTAIGIATCFIGLAIVLPLIAHASWHAYRDIVEAEVESAR